MALFSSFIMACSDDSPKNDEKVIQKKAARLTPNTSEISFPDTLIGKSNSVTLNIANEGDYVASQLSISIPAAPLSLASGTCSSELSEGSSCSITIDFNPTAASTYIRNLTISYNDGEDTQSVSISLVATSSAPPVPVLSGLSDQLTPVKSINWSWDCDLTCEYRFEVNASPTHVFTDEAYSAINSHSQTTGTQVYYLHVQARSTEYGTETDVSSVSVVLDNTAPVPMSNLTMDSDATETKTTTLHFDAGSDETEFSHYEIAVGLTAGTSDVVDWINVGIDTEIQFNGGSFANGTNYYTTIKAVDKAGNESTTLTTAAWMPPGPPGAVTNLSVTAALTNQITIGWSEPYHNGLVIIDYYIYYKETADADWILYNDGVSVDTVSTITDLTPSTSYDFKVIAFNGSSAEDSNIATAETAPENEFFEPNSYRAMNLGGAHASQVVVLDDEATVELIRGGEVIETYEMDFGTPQVLTTEINDIIRSDKPMFVAGLKGDSTASDRNKGNMVWSTPDWAGKLFNFTGSRYAPHLVTVFAFEDTDITVTKGATQIDSKSLLAEESHTFSVTTNGGFVIDSTGLIIAHMHSSGSSSVADPRPLLPASNDILGFPSTKMKMATITDANSYDGFHSNGTTTSGTISSGTEKTINAVGTNSLYRSEALRIVASEKVVANSHADSNGYCSAPFVPVGMLKKRYAINVSSGYVAFASVEAGTITITAPDGTTSEVDLVRTDESPYVPYKARVTNQAAGTKYESTTRFQAWYQPDNSVNAAINDETIMFGFDE